MNTCIVCLDTVVEDSPGILRTVGTPFLPKPEHVHQTTEAVAAAATPIAA